MDKSLLTLVVVISLVSAVACDKWALLVAGSNTYDNYRHQADICHAYHVLHNHGIPDDRIVVMMYDDIAHNEENPYKGNIINEPRGPNLYPGVLKDYTGKDVNPEVFLKVLSGDEKGVEALLGRKGKVIKSGPNDHVFVNFADHGGPDILAFPDDELHAEDLNNVILKMHKNRQYKEMVFYVEACESGSIFDRLLRKDINVFATTAANPQESSFATYWDQKRQVYLGDVYSVKWMQDSDVENLNSETLQEQFERVKKETNTSHVCEYGDRSIGKQKVGEFQGSSSTLALKFRSENMSRYDPNIGAIPSEDVPLETLKRRIEVAEGKKLMLLSEKYRALTRKYEETDKFFKHVVALVSDMGDFDRLSKDRVRSTDFKCYKESIRMMKSKCPGMTLTQNDRALRRLRVLANLCESGIAKERVWAAVRFAATESGMC